MKVKALLACKSTKSHPASFKEHTITIYISPRPYEGLFISYILLIVGLYFLQVVVPCGLFPSDKVMEALAYQADPGSFDN